MLRRSSTQQPQSKAHHDDSSAVTAKSKRDARSTTSRLYRSLWSRHSVQRFLSNFSPARINKPHQLSQNQLVIAASVLTVWTLSLLTSTYVRWVTPSNTTKLSLTALYQQSLQHQTESNQNFLSKYGLDETDSLGDYRYRLLNMSIEIFTSPKPFRKGDRDYRLQIETIRSWKRLQRRQKQINNLPMQFTILGDDTSYAPVAKKYKLNHVKQIDTSFQGIPLFNSIISKANESDASIACFINADIHLHEDFINSLAKVVELFKEFLVVAGRYDISQDNYQVSKGMRKGVNNDRFHSFIKKHSILHTYGGMDIWCWNTRGSRLISNDLLIPPFALGRGRYDNWLTHEAIQAKHKAVIDITETSYLIHVEHDYHLVTNGDRLERQVAEDYWSEGKYAKFELFINVYLSLTYGSYIYQKGGIINAPWKLMKCYEKAQSDLCVLKRVRPGVCPCESSPFTRDTQSDPVVTRGTKIIRCGRVIPESLSNYTLPITRQDGIDIMKTVEITGEDSATREVTEPTFGLPLTLEGLLKRQVENNTVILTGVNFGYKTMVMNWVCNLKRLNMNNILIAALDKEMYQYGFLNSLPIFLFDDLVDEATNVEYGSDQFRRLTKFKTRIVVKVLSYGVNVLWSDVDIVYFNNPLPDIYANHYDNADIIIQSNAPDGVSLNHRRRLNSGFYFAKATSKVMTTFKHIIRYCVTAEELSEQPCFYDVVCGQHAEFARDNDKCVYADKVPVQILDTEYYPNGLTQAMWNYTASNGIYDHWSHIFMLHNNWIVGYDSKWKRFVDHGFVFWDSYEATCIFNEVRVPISQLQADSGDEDELDQDLNH